MLDCSRITTTMLHNYKLTPAQLEALTRLAQRWETKVSTLLDHAHPEAGNPETACLMVPLGRDMTNPTLWVGIERDGYTHS